MKILLLADTESEYIWDYYDENTFKDIDFILAAGDLKASYLEYVSTVTKKTLYYVMGNHDTSYDTKPPLGCICIDGKVVDIKGIKVLGLGGSMKYSKGVNQYSERQMTRRFNKLKLSIYKQGGIDIFLAHSPAFGVEDGEDLCHKGFKVFHDILSLLNPTYFIHGHKHLNYDYKAKRIYTIGNTTCINAYNYHILECEPTSFSKDKLSLVDVFLGKS